MKLHRIHIEGFGVWKGLRLEPLSDRATVFFGENEAGKTTLMEFVRAVLYGPTPARCARYLPPVYGGRPGGALEVRSGRERLVLQRSLAQPGDAPLHVLREDGGAEDAGRLAELLGDVDEATYENVFALGLDELQQLATLHDTAAAEQLYKLTTGLDRVSLFDVMQELQRSRRRMLAPPGEPSQVGRLLDRQTELTRQLAECRRGWEAWTRQAVERRQIDEEIQQLEGRVGSLHRQVQTLAAARLVLPAWRERVQVDRELETFGPVTALPADALAQMGRITARLQKRRLRLRKWTQTRRRLHRAMQRLRTPDDLWRIAARVEALGEQQPWIAALGRQIEELGVQQQQLQSQLGVQQQRFGLDRGAAARISETMLASLKEPARTLREQQRRLAEVQQELAQCETAAEERRVRLESGLSARGVADLTGALERAGALVTQLRHRIHCDERLDQLQRQRKDLEYESGTLYEQQVLSAGKLAAVGALFILGVVMLLSGLMGSVLGLAGGLAWALIVLGPCGVASSVMVKQLWEKAAADRLACCTRQRELVEKQIERALHERDELDRALPRGGGPLAARLQTAEAELAALEQLVPLDSERSAAQRLREDAQRRQAEAEESLRKARRRWREALRAAGLPETLSPRQVHDLAGSAAAVGSWSRKLNELREELEQRGRELAGVRKRIDELAQLLKVELTGDDPVDQVRQLAERVARLESAARRRGALRKKAARLARQRKQILTEGRKLLAQRRRLMAAAGVTDEAEYRRLALRLSRIQQLRQRREELTAEILAALAGQCAEEELERLFAGASEMELGDRADRVAARYDADQQRLALLYERRGRIAGEMAALVEDRRGDELRLELAAVEEQLDATLARWKVLAVATILLDEVRKRYEAERQPETLRRASRYLERMTRGQYRRVWTPLDQRALRVDDQRGESLPVELLSRGTREQVFLALRLALVAMYAQRGWALPVVLDDVLVNFDAPRAAAAAEVLRDFAAEGHQLLVFTCHEHIAKAFEALGVETRRLPSYLALAGQEVPLTGGAPAIEAPLAEIEDAAVDAAPTDAPAEVELEAEVETEADLAAKIEADDEYQLVTEFEDDAEPAAEEDEDLTLAAVEDADLAETPEEEAAGVQVEDEDYALAPLEDAPPAEEVLPREAAAHADAFDPAHAADGLWYAEDDFPPCRPGALGEAHPGLPENSGSRERDVPAKENRPSQPAGLLREARDSAA